MSPVNFDGNNYLVFLHASHMPFYGSTPSVSPLSFAAHSIYSPVHVPVPNSSIPRRSPLPPPLSTFPGHGYPRPCALHVRSHPAFYLFFVHSAPPFPLLSCLWLFSVPLLPLLCPHTRTVYLSYVYALRPSQFRNVIICWLVFLNRGALRERRAPGPVHGSRSFLVVRRKMVSRRANIQRVIQTRSRSKKQDAVIYR